MLCQAKFYITRLSGSFKVRKALEIEADVSGINLNSKTTRGDEVTVLQRGKKLRSTVQNGLSMRAFIQEK